MSTQRTAGIVALASGALLALLLVASAAGAPAGSAGAYGPWQMGPGMMGSGQWGSDWMRSWHTSGGMMGTGGGMMGYTSSGPAATAIPNATEVRVQVSNFAFAPVEIRLPKGTDVNLTLVNPSTTGVVHDLTVPALGIHVVANAGETKSIGLRNLAPGRYDALCSVPGHADLGMRATVIVE